MAELRRSEFQYLQVNFQIRPPVNPDLHVCMYTGEGRDEAMASGGQILETKKEPEIVLLKYLYYPPENLSSRRHGFIPTFMYVCTVQYYMWHVVHVMYMY